MFLATEGLYAEALRQPQFVEEILQKYRIMIAGPTTLSAIVSSLRMGFQTLVVEKRASEVWRVLGAVKTEFGKFGGVLDKVHRQLSTATRTIEETGTRLEPWLPKYPDINIEIISDIRFTDIVAERFDIGVRLGGDIAKDIYCGTHGA
jgi:hypothetical protein